MDDPSVLIAPHSIVYAQPVPQQWDDRLHIYRCQDCGVRCMVDRASGEEPSFEFGCSAVLGYRTHREMMVEAYRAASQPYLSNPGVA